MSSRNIRKLLGNTAQPPPEGSSDEEYEPLYAKNSTLKYHGLVLSSDSESEHESTDIVGIENTPPKENNKKKKKNRKSMPGTSSKEGFEMDEIDKCVMEVNAMLGVPTAPADSTEQTKNDPVTHVQTVHYKYISEADELTRMFGPKEPEVKSRGRQPYRFVKRSTIVDVADNMKLKKIGLSMSINRRENGCTFFTFDHNKEYQRMHQTYLRSVIGRTNDVMPMDENQRTLHIEQMLETADLLFRYEEYPAANTLVEQSIAYMQYVAHPHFNIMDRGTRLEYKFMENRPFHIALLKYVHLLTNRACHRTALELAKLLLNLDPSDPLAVLFFIDTPALRAREHQWLIDAIDYWFKEREAKYYFNLQYSYALAHFHVATKNKGDLAEADKLLQDIMTCCPAVVVKILECASMTSLCERLQSHALFKLGEEKTKKYFKDLIHLYAKFTWPKWREPDVFDWLTRNVNELLDKYDKDVGVQEFAKKLAHERHNLFHSWPVQIFRHLIIIKPMANLLVEGAVPRVIRARSCDPIPPSVNVNRYDYILAGNTSPGDNNSSLFALFASILPNYRNEFPENIVQNNQRAALEEGQNNVEIEPDFDAGMADVTFLGDVTFMEGEMSMAEETYLIEDTRPENELPAAESSGEATNLVESLGAVANAVSHCMDGYETGNDPEVPDQNVPRQDQDREN